MLHSRRSLFPSTPHHGQGMVSSPTTRENILNLCETLIQRKTILLSGLFLYTLFRRRWLLDLLRQSQSFNANLAVLCLCIAGRLTSSGDLDRSVSVWPGFHRESRRFLSVAQLLIILPITTFVRIAIVLAPRTGLYRQNVRVSSRPSGSRPSALRSITGCV